jgi:hypothetical protein
MKLTKNHPHANLVAALCAFPAHDFETVDQKVDSKKSVMRCTVCGCRMSVEKINRTNDLLRKAKASRARAAYRAAV